VIHLLSHTQLVTLIIHGLTEALHRFVSPGANVSLDAPGAHPHNEDLRPEFGAQGHRPQVHRPMVFRRAKPRSSGSLEVNTSSRKSGGKNQLTVARGNGDLLLRIETCSGTAAQYVQTHGSDQNAAFHDVLDEVGHILK